MASLFEDTSEEEGELDIEVKVDPAYEEKYLERKRREELSRRKYFLHWRNFVTTMHRKLPSIAYVLSIFFCLVCSEGSRN